MITFLAGHVTPYFRPGNIDPDSVAPGGGSTGSIALFVIAGLVILVIWMTKKDSEAQKQQDLESQRFYQELKKEREEKERQASAKDSDEDIA